MRNPGPPIREDEARLKPRLQHEHDRQKKPRLHMLYLLATRQAHDRQNVARLLGVHRNPVGRWLARSAAGGTDALLATYVPAGKPGSRTPDVLASLEQARRRPEGFASSEALRQWVRQTHGVEVKDKTLYPIVRPRFRPKLKVPRPSHTKKSGGHSSVPGCLWRTPPGGSVQQAFEWFSVYGAVEPITGDRFFLEWPSLHAARFQLFGEASAQAFADRLNSLLLDNRGAPTSQRLTLPENVQRLFLPPDCPEGNPMERVWRDRKDDMAWQPCAELHTQHDDLGHLLQAYEAATLQSLAGYPSLVEAIHALCE